MFIFTTIAFYSIEHGGIFDSSVKWSNKKLVVRDLRRSETQEIFVNTVNMLSEYPSHLYV
jgi:hypothetical protein